MGNNLETQRQIADCLRKTHKELRWAAQNIAAIHEMMRPADEPPIEDPMQLKLFDDECPGI